MRKRANTTYTTISPKSSFRTLLSTPSSLYYEATESLDNSPFYVYLVELRLKYGSQDPPFQNKVTFSWCQLCDVNSSVHYCTEGYVQIPNKEILSLTYGVNKEIFAVRKIFQHKLTYKFQTETYIRWNGDALQKEFTMRPFRDHFTFDWPLGSLHPKYPMLPCYSSSYI